jgi:hypothetical protein
MQAKAKNRPGLARSTSCQEGAGGGEIRADAAEEYTHVYLDESGSSWLCRLRFPCTVHNHCVIVEIARPARAGGGKRMEQRHAQFTALSKLDKNPTGA